MISGDVILLTQKLLSFETWKGNEEAPARFLGELLSENGFHVFYDQLAEGRLSLIAEKGLSGHIPPVVLPGHLDTVQVGHRQVQHQDIRVQLGRQAQRFQAAGGFPGQCKSRLAGN